MTIPTQHNCPHSKTGWCLLCVQSLQEQLDALKHDIERHVGICAELATQLEAKEKDRQLHERAAHDSDARCQAAVRGERAERTERNFDNAARARDNERLKAAVSRLREVEAALGALITDVQNKWGDPHTLNDAIRAFAPQTKGMK